MKISQNEPDEKTENVQTGPKFRNIHEEKETMDELKPTGVDIRLKLVIALILILTVFTGVSGSIARSSLMSQLEEQKKLFTEAEAEALLYGITKDEDDDLVLPVTDAETSVDVSELDWDSVEQRNHELLDSFANLLLKWEGREGYEKVRQTLLNDWEFTEDSRLLTGFMPEMDEEINASMSLSNYTTFVLSNDGKNMSYFLICTVRNTVTGSATGEKRSTTGTVGIRITINEDGTLSNVMAQTLS